MKELVLVLVLEKVNLVSLRLSKKEKGKLSRFALTLKIKLRSYLKNKASLASLKSKKGMQCNEMTQQVNLKWNEMK